MTELTTIEAGEAVVIAALGFVRKLRGMGDTPDPSELESAVTAFESAAIADALDKWKSSKTPDAPVVRQHVRPRPIPMRALAELADQPVESEPEAERPASRPPSSGPNCSRGDFKPGDL